MAIIFTPGQVVAAPDWEALFQQHGGSKSSQIRLPTKEEQRAIEDAGGDLDQNPIYQYYAEDGSRVEARTASNGDYQIVSYTPSEKFKKSAAASADTGPPGGKPYIDEEGPNGRRLGWNPATQQYDRDLGSSPSAQAAAAGASKRVPVEGKPGVYQVTTKSGTAEETHYEDEGGNRIATPTAPPKVVPGTAGRPAVQYVPDPDNPGQVKAVPIPGAPEAPEQQLSAPSDQMWIAVQKPGQPPEFVKNPNYVKPSHIMPDPADPTKLINITHDNNGNVISEPVTGQTAIKPVDLPVLQTTYGQIAQGLGALAQDLNSRYARGEITEKQKNDAFTAAHQQASTQVAEINSILERSTSIWSGELTQRQQSLAETQSRRSFASGVLGNALETGNSIAKGAAGKGAGRDIVNGMAAILGIGKQYAEGMGGFRESPEVPLPAALQQARGIGLPGYGPAAAPAGPPGGPPAPGGLPAPLLRPPPPVTGSVAPPGAPPPVPLPGMAPTPGAQPPVPLPSPAATPGAPPPVPMPGLQGMQQQLMSGQAYAGAPVAAGGTGLWDPTSDVAQMIGDGSDPAWADAVRQAAATVTQPGYAWQRFTQPPSRFG